MRALGFGSNAAAMVFGFRWSGTPAFDLSPAGFGPAVSSSSKMEDEARSPRTSDPPLEGAFFLRYSSVSGFLGFGVESSCCCFPVPHPIVLKSKNVRRWRYGRRKGDRWELGNVAESIN